MPISKLWLCQNCETLQPLTQLTCEVCGESIPVEFRKPVISEFKASAKQARENDRLVFSWKTDFAKYVFLNGIRVSANGTKEIPATKKVTLKVSNGNGSIEKSINIKVTHALELNDFTVNENNIEFGKDCIVTWSGRNIKKVSFEGKEFSPEGPIVFQPTGSSDFVVLFVGVDGDTAKRSFAVHVFYPSPIININAPAFAKIGEIIHVNWNTEYVSFVKIDGIEQPLCGSFEWTFSEVNKDKSIIFIDMEGVPHEKTISVKEAIPPTILSFHSTAEEVVDNEQVILRWSTKNAKYIFLNGIRVAANGSKELPALDSYVLKASNEFGATESTVRVNVLHPIEITYFEVIQTDLIYGTPCIVAWSGRNVCNILIEGKEYGILSPLTFSPIESRTYVVTFEGFDGQVIEKSIDIDITFPEPVFNIETSKYGQPGTMVKIEWEMEYVKSVKIGDFEVSPNGAFEWQYEQDDCSKTLHITGLDNTSFDKTITIRAAHPPIINNILLSKDKLKKGDSCRLSWSGDYVEEWFVEDQSKQGGDVRSTIVKIDSEVINVHFIGEEGTEITKNVNIYIVHEPEVVECEFSPEVPVGGQSTRLEWRTKGVQEVKIEKALFFPKSHFESGPYRNEDIQIPFIGEDKHIVEDMHVIFPEINILYFKSNSNNIIKGSNCVISWSATNVTRVDIKGKRFSPVGSFEYTPESSETITAVFIGDDGSIQRRSLKILVTEPEPKNNHGCLNFILYFWLTYKTMCLPKQKVLLIFVIAVAFIVWAYFFRHGIYNEIIYILKTIITYWRN